VVLLHAWGDHYSNNSEIENGGWQYILVSLGHKLAFAAYAHDPELLKLSSCAAPPG